MPPASNDQEIRKSTTTLVYLLSVFSFLIALINAVQGARYIVALLPLLVLTVVIPIIEGLVISSLTQEWVVFNARGWTGFIIGFGGMLVYMLMQFAIGSKDTLSIVLTVALTTLICYGCYKGVRRAVRYFENIEEIDPPFIEHIVVAETYGSAGGVIWALSQIGVELPGETALLGIALFFVGLMIWIVLVAAFAILDLSEGSPEWTGAIITLGIITILVLVIGYFIMLTARIWPRV